MALIGERLWKRTLRRRSRRTRSARLIVNDVPLTVIGILPDGFAGLSGKAEIWIPPPMAARLYYADYLTTPQNFISVVARLKDGVSLRAGERGARGDRAAVRRQRIDARHVWSAAAVPLGEARVDPTRAAVGAGAARAPRRACC